MKNSSFVFPVQKMVLTALFAAVLCVVAPFSVAIGPIPLTFATLMIYMAAGTLGWKYGVLSVFLYILLGAVGLPVFSNFRGGFHTIAGVTGGYIIGYIPCALATGLIIEVLQKKLWTYVLGMVIGTVLLYTCGTIWFVHQTGNSITMALALCVIPFLIGDIIKITLACIIVPKLRSTLSKM